DGALGARTTTADRPAGAAEVEEAHGLETGGVAADTGGPAGEALRLGIEGVYEDLRGKGQPVTAGADAHALVAQRRPGDGPPAIDRSDDIVIGDEDVVEEDLVEVRGAVDLT